MKCVICWKLIPPGSVHVDTCGERCYKALLEHQRRVIAAIGPKHMGGNLPGGIHFPLPGEDSLAGLCKHCLETPSGMFRK